MTKSYQEISIVRWNGQDIAGVIRTNGFRGYVLCPSVPLNMGNSIDETIYSRSHIFDIDGNRYTIFHHNGFSTNKRTFSATGSFISYRCNVSWVIKNAHITNIDYGLLSHPNLEGFLYDEIAELYHPEDKPV